MAIDPIGGNSQLSMLDLWNKRIRANRDDALPNDSSAVNLSPDGKIRLSAEQSGLSSASKTDEAPELETKEDDDIYTRQIKDLLRQLRRVMEQIRKIEASSQPPEQKSEQLQTLNSQATQIMGQIQKVLVAKAMQSRS